MGAQVEEVRVDEQSSAATLRRDTQQRAYQSLPFFLTSVLRVPVPFEVAASLQGLGLRRLVMVLAGATLWCRLHKASSKTDPAQQDAVRWLFPEAKDF
jgi:hypothetical protein